MIMLELETGAEFREEFTPQDCENPVHDPEVCMIIGCRECRKVENGYGNRSKELP